MKIFFSADLEKVPPFVLWILQFNISIMMSISIMMIIITMMMIVMIVIINGWLPEPDCVHRKKPKLLIGSENQKLWSIDFSKWMNGLEWMDLWLVLILGYLAWWYLVWSPDVTGEKAPDIWVSRISPDFMQLIRYINQMYPIYWQNSEKSHKMAKKGTKIIHYSTQ